VFLLLAVVLLLVLPSPWGLVGFAVGLVCFGGEVLFWHRRVRGRRALVGVQTLIGESATVVSSCRPTGQVRVSGEIWAAHCELGADPGETVAVVGRSRLTLIVERIPDT
jgi:membrane protein implicated in regulation of membrane protease activity